MRHPLHGRREFVAGLCRSGAALAAGPWLVGSARAQGRSPARVVLQRSRYRSDMDRRVLEWLKHAGVEMKV